MKSSKSGRGSKPNGEEGNDGWLIMTDVMRRPWSRDAGYAVVLTTRCMPI